MEKRKTESAKLTAELEAQVEKANLSISQKDRIISNMQEDKRRLTRNVHNRTAATDKLIKEGKETKAEGVKLSAELQAQVVGANQLRKVAKAKISEQETLVAEAAKQQQLAEQRAIEQEALASERIDAKIEEVAHALE